MLSIPFRCLHNLSMARSLRIQYPGAHYHAMCRGNDGQEIFFHDDGRRLFLHTLTEACEQTGWRVHAYCLMSNHYHLLLETPEANLVDGMKWFQGTYTQRINAMRKRRGHLFQGRYKAIPIQTDPRDGGLEYFRQVSTYIHLNPYRAQLCGVGMPSPLESYEWSSYPAYVGKVRKPFPWLTREKVLKTWGLSGSDNSSLLEYRQKLERVMKFDKDPQAGRRGEFEESPKKGWFLGSDLFKAKLDNLVKGRTEKDTFRGEQRRDHGISEAERLLTIYLRSLDIQEEDLIKSKNTRLEKQAVAWVLKTKTTVTGVWIAERLQMGHRVNASKAISRFRNSEEEDVKKLKAKMLQSTA